ncbi:MAG: fumarylacetoacetate hydrolase family protein [Alphaproteobacteria bacterium]|nr:fumarylacetoacetate hydrolase family protein [Alphaproteobacteria bacterium]
MRLARISKNQQLGIATRTSDGVRAVFGRAELDDFQALIAQGSDGLHKAGEIAAAGELINIDNVNFLPPLPCPSKIICLGLNYADHAAEGGFEPPKFPTLFGRFASSLVGHGAPIVLPKVSSQLDYEGELVAVIGKQARHVTKDQALEHVIAYSVFNDGSIRDYQMRTPQWTAGKNFDNTGAFGPWLVTANELPPGATGLMLETRLNRQIVQRASTSNMIFDVATTVSLLSEFLTLVAGDVLVMGTPSGVGAARTPPLFMKAGDVCEVEIEGVGLLRNPIVAE